MRLAVLAVLAVPAATAPAGPTPAQAGPTLTSISPDQAGVGATVTLNGTDLIADASVTTIQFGTTEVDSSNCSTDSCTITIPALPGTGVVDVTVATSFGTSNALPFTYAPLGPPNLSAVDPNQSDANGSTTVSFTGDAFSTAPGATTFELDEGSGHFFTNVSCSGPTQCTASGPVISLDCGPGAVVSPTTTGRASQSASAV